MKNQLWAVYVDQSKESLAFEHIWVIAATPETAISKARVWFKKNGITALIDKIESHGTVDVL